MQSSPTEQPQVPRAEPAAKPGDAPDAQPDSESEQSRLALLRRQRWLPVLMFIGTFLGTSIGFAADLTEAIQGWAVPIMQRRRPSPRLRIVGSNTVLGEEIGLAGEWQEAFEAQQAWEDCILGGLICADRTIDVTIEPGGSLDGFNMAARGEAELVVASEAMPLNMQQEIEKEHTIACAAVIGYDVIAFVTDINNEGPAIQARDLPGILRGSSPNWGDLEGWEDDQGEPRPIRIIARHGSGTTDLILREVGQLSQSEDDAEPIPIPGHFVTLPPTREGAGGELLCEDEDDDPADGCEPCSSNDACLDQALNLPGSLYWVSTAWLHTQPPRFMRVILVEYDGWKAYPLYPICSERPGVQEDQEPCFDPEQYDPRLVRPLYMYVIGGGQLSAESTELAREFLEYVLGRQGQAMLEDHHFYTHFFSPPAEVKVKLPAGFEPREDGTPRVCRE